jgi:hypothetical protein
LNSPKRIAVAVLGIALGFLVRQLWQIEVAPMVGFFGGLFAAQLVPTSGACAVPPRAPRREN